MKQYPFPYPWKDLPGRAEELAFLEKRFSEMSVREQYLTEGACQIESVETAADLVNITRQLHNFELLFGAVDVESLGRYVGEHEMRITPQQAPFMDYAAIGEDYMEQRGCVFTEKGCVVQERSCAQLYRGNNLADMIPYDPMRIKLSSKECPEGVWLLIPDNEINGGGPNEMAVALDALGVNAWSRTLVLDVRCCFDNLTGIAEQYNSVEALLFDANNFGYVYEEAGQGSHCFRQHWQAAMELEGCTRLDYALAISQNLYCYDFMPAEQHWEKYGAQQAGRKGIVASNSEAAKYFDCAAYCKSEIDRLGLDCCEHGYIRRSGQEFCYEHSQPPQQDFGMEMK